MEQDIVFVVIRLDPNAAGPIVRGVWRTQKLAQEHVNKQDFPEQYVVYNELIRDEA